MDKLVLSYEQGEKLRGMIGTELRDKYTQLQGRLLTTLDTVIDNKAQLEGMKARVRDIQGRMWGEIHRQKESILETYFGFCSKKEEPNKVDEKDLEEQAEKLADHIWYIIRDEFSNFDFRLKNLLGAIFQDTDSRLDCVKEEIDRIINETRYQLTRLLNLGIQKIFNVKFEPKIVTD